MGGGGGQRGSNSGQVSGQRTISAEGEIQETAERKKHESVAL